MVLFDCYNIVYASLCMVYVLYTYQVAYNYEKNILHNVYIYFNKDRIQQLISVRFVVYLLLHSLIFNYYVGVGIFIIFI